MRTESAEEGFLRAVCGDGDFTYYIFISGARSAAAHRSDGAGVTTHKSGVLSQKGNYPLTRSGRDGILDTVKNSDLLGQEGLT